MIKQFVVAVSIGATLFLTTPSYAQQLVESYVAFLSEADHFNSNGQRLRSAAEIIRQDRANYHRYGIRDPQDQGDSFFGSESNRAALERMLEAGQAAPGIVSRIVNQTVLIRVDIYRSESGPFIRITLLN